MTAVCVGVRDAAPWCVAISLLTVVEARGVRSGRAGSSPSSAFTTAAWACAISLPPGLRAAS